MSMVNLGWCFSLTGFCVCCRQGSGEQSSRSRSSGDGQRERQSLGGKPNASGGSNMSRDEIKEHAENILERMRGESHHIPTKVGRACHVTLRG